MQFTSICWFFIVFSIRFWIAEARVDFHTKRFNELGGQVAPIPESNEVITSIDVIYAPYTTQMPSISIEMTTPQTLIISTTTPKPQTHLPHSQRIPPNAAKNPRMNWRHRLLITTTPKTTIIPSSTTTTAPLAAKTTNAVIPKEVKNEPQTSENTIPRSLDYSNASEENGERNESAIEMMLRTSTTTTERTTTPEPSNFLQFFFFPKKKKTFFSFAWQRQNR